MQVFLNGKFISKNKAKVSVFDHGFLYGDGVFETLRTYNGKIWQVKSHIKRLRESAKLIGLKLPWKNFQIEQWMEEAIKRNKFKESRIRATVTRGENDFYFSEAKKPTICIIAQEFIDEPKEIYEKGVSVITFASERILPRAKTIDLIPNILARRKMERKKAFEALLINREGVATEGSISNFFIIKKGVLITAGKEVLWGTTRELILKIAKNTCPIHFKNITKEEIYSADECFISNTLKGIVPVAKADGRKIGNGKAGEMTRKIMEKFASAKEDLGARI